MNVEQVVWICTSAFVLVMTFRDGWTRLQIPSGNKGWRMVRPEILTSHPKLTLYMKRKVLAIKVGWAVIFLGRMISSLFPFAGSLGLVVSLLGGVVTLAAIYLLKNIEHDLPALRTQLTSQQDTSQQN